MTYFWGSSLAYRVKSIFSLETDQDKSTSQVMSAGFPGYLPSGHISVSEGVTQASKYLHAGVENAWFGKRALDIAICLAACPAALLMISIAAILIYCTSGGPVFFTQDRVGLFGRVFKIYKLRTMGRSGSRTDPTLQQDPRITPIGAILRKYRIDELPQLLNVLKGDMSVIGPRPEQPQLAERYASCIQRFSERHAMKPGITGLAQVQYHYAADASETRNKVRYDLIYIHRQSLWLDLWIIYRTIAVILTGFGSR